MRIIWSLAFLMFTASSAALGQDCEDALGYARETSIVDRDKEARTNFERHFCDKQSSSKSEADQNAAGIGISLPFESFPIEFDGHRSDSSSSWSDYKRSLCEHVRTAGQLSETVRIAVQKTNEAVIAAWAQCIDSQGVKFWAEVDPTTPYDVILVARYVSRVPPFSTPLSRGAEPITYDKTLFHCFPGSIAVVKRKGYLDASDSTIQCRRRTEQGLSIVLNAPDQKRVQLRALGAESCNSSAEIVDAIFNNVMPPANLSGRMLPPDNARRQWMELLRGTGNLKAVASEMLGYNHFRQWIVGASLGMYPNDLPTAYSVMANAAYWQLLGSALPAGDPRAAEFVAGMPQVCSLSDINDDCHRRFLEQARSILDTGPWAEQYAGNTVPVFDYHPDHRNRLRTLKYCRSISECRADQSWCPD